MSELIILRSGTSGCIAHRLIILAVSTTRRGAPGPLAPWSLAAKAGGARTAGAAARLARARELGVDLSPPLLKYRRPPVTPNARRQPRRRGGGCTPRLGGPVCALRGDFENPGPRSAYAARCASRQPTGVLRHTSWY